MRAAVNPVDPSEKSERPSAFVGDDQLYRSAMPYITASDGVRLHYEIVGSGSPLVLHLGAGGDSELWRAAGYIEALAAEHRCILFDHRGHGRSDHPTGIADHHIDRYVADVVALCDQLRLERITFYGWSNGLIVGLKLAAEQPALVERLILAGAMGRRVDQDQLITATAERLTGMRERGWWYLLDDMVAAEPSPIPQWFLDRVAATDQGPWFAYTQARPTWGWSPWDALPDVGCPALILVGELEDPDDVMGEVAAVIPEAVRVRVPGKEHINAFLDVQFVLPIVSDFLGDGPSWPAGDVATDR